MYKLPFLLWLLATIVPLAMADASTRLQDGTPIVIDEGARAVYVLQGTARRPLWDGVYRLEDGSTLTISRGVLINAFNASENVRNEAPSSLSRCELLVKRTCGGDNHCSTTAGCSAARQLLQLEEKERLPGNPPTVRTTTSDACAEALGDSAYFVPCTTTAP